MAEETRDFFCIDIRNNDSCCFCICGIWCGSGKFTSRNDNKTADKRKKADFSYRTHHIVAQQDLRAIISVHILKSVGLTTETPENKVVLSQSFHSSLHTNAYHRWVTIELVNAVYQCEIPCTIEGSVRSSLKDMGKQLQIWDYMFVA